MSSPDIGVGLKMLSEGRADEAYEVARQGVEAFPESAEWHHFSGFVASAAGDVLQAINHLAMAVTLDPSNVEILCNLALTLIDGADMPVEAENTARRALSINPEHAPAWHLLGISLDLQGRHGEAAVSFSTAIDFNPDHASAHNNLAMNRLLRGQFAAGWLEAEWRRKLGGEEFERFSHVPEWQGGPQPDKTIVIAAEQGLGDILQFIRYIPLVAERVGSVIVECPAVMRDLIAAVDGVDQVVCEGEEHPPFHTYIFIMSLPLIFGGQEKDFPSTVPYLRGPEGVTADLPKAEGKRAVGIIWAGASHHANDRRRSFAVSAFAPLAALDDVQLYSLQLGERGDDLKTVAWGENVRDLRGQIETFSDTAAIMAELDLIISVDTAPVHLAGALGRPVWTLLPFCPDWRWQLDRADSPWYPTMRLFRQPTPGDWDGVMRDVVDALEP